MTLQYTPGPWTVEPYIHPSRTTPGSYCIYCEETDEYSDTLIAEVYGPGVEHPDMEGNARLMAASSELFVLARKVRNQIPNHELGKVAHDLVARLESEL